MVHSGIRIHAGSEALRAVAIHGDKGVRDTTVAEGPWKRSWPAQPLVSMGKAQVDPPVSQTGLPLIVVPPRELET